MRDGLYQGHCLSSVLFCLGLQRAVRRCLTAYSASSCASEGAPVRFEYIDDVLLKMRAGSVATWMPFLRDALLSMRLKLNLAKCKAWIPSAVPGQLHTGLLDAGVPQGNCLTMREAGAVLRNTV